MSVRQLSLGRLCHTKIYHQRKHSSQQLNSSQLVFWPRKEPKKIYKIYDLFHLGILHEMDERSTEENAVESTSEAIQQNGTTETSPVASATVSQENSDDDTENYNPEKMPDELKEAFLVDAIGDTLYSKRFVLQTLLNLNKVEAKLSEEFEKDLCTLWDMTVEKDVVKLLLEHNVVEIFSGIIQLSEDQRLVEILLGVLGNMSALAETRDALCQQPDVMIPIIDLISCSDSMILIQLMRLFHTCLVFENSGDEYIWFQHFRCADQFVDKFAFILANSMSTTLLLHTYEALNAICTKFAIIEIQPEILDSSGFRDIFVKRSLVTGVLEAFKQMLPDSQRAPDAPLTDGDNSQSNCSQVYDDISAPTKRTQRITHLFLDINVILSQYDETSQQVYAPFMRDLMKCISKCLRPLCQPMYLLPLTSNEQILIENVNELVQALDDPFDEMCFNQMITIWSLIEKHQLAKESTIKEPKSEWDHDDEVVDEEEVSGIDVNMSILEYLTRTSKNASVDRIEAGVTGIGQETIISLHKALSAGNAEEDIDACCEKLKEAAKSIWNIELINNDDFSDSDDEVEVNVNNGTSDDGKAADSDNEVTDAAQDTEQPSSTQS